MPRMASRTIRLERYEPDAARAVQDAQRLADARRNPEVEPVHLLHTLVEAGRSGAAVVREMGVDPDDLLLEAENLVRRLPRVDGGVAYLAPHFHELLARAETESGDQLVDEAALLVALGLEAEGAIARLFRTMGLRAAAWKTSAATVRATRPRAAADTTPKSPGERPMTQQSFGARPAKTSTLDELGRDLVEVARRGEADPIVGRDTEVRRILSVVTRRTENNVLLVGEPGIGKRAIVQGLANRIAAGNVPQHLARKRVVLVELSTLLAGARLRGEGEERLRSLLAATRGSEVLLFVPDISMLVGDRAPAGVAGLLAGALSRGELRLVATTTPDVVKRMSDDEPALFARFVVITVEPPTPDEAVAILRGLVGRFEAVHGVRITDPAIAAAVRFAKRYVPGVALPKAAVDLLDEASAKLRVELDGTPEALDILEEKLRSLELQALSLEDDTDAESVRARTAIIDEITATRPLAEQQREAWKRARTSGAEVRRLTSELAARQHEYEEAKTRGDHGRAGELRFGVIPLLEKDLATHRASLGEGPKTAESVGEAEVADIVAAWTGVPIAKMMQGEQERLLHMESTLAARVVGQDAAVLAVSKAVRRGRVGLRDPRRPIGSFLFLGPTGVGKTELAKALAEFLFDDDASLTRLDMSEFMEKHMVARLLGAPPGYVDSGEGGFLTEAVRRRPYSVVLFDEVEKAHPDVFNILLQVLDDGRLTDSRGRLAHFSDTVLILTSNVGSHAILERASEVSDDDAGRSELRALIDEELRKHFRPEFLNRIDDVVIFNPLGRKELRGIVDIQVRQVGKLLADRRITLEVDDDAKAELVELGYEPAFGARPLRRAVLRSIQDPLAEEILRGGYGAGDVVRVGLGDGRFTFTRRAGATS